LNTINTTTTTTNIIRIIKSRRIKSAENVECMGVKQSAYRALVGKPEERDHYED
jgi:hypothetical protein